MTESDIAQQDGRTAPAVKRLLVVLSAHEPEATGPSEAKDERDIELIRYAADLAERWNADLSAFVPVERPGEIGRIASATGLPVSQIEKRLVDAQQERAARLLEKAVPGHACELHAGIGKPFMEIIRHVVRHETDLVLKTAEQLPGLSRYLFASTDQHLLRKCPVPVWLRTEDASPQVRTILAAVDVDDALASEPETLAGLNRRIVETAGLIASALGAELYLLNVWDAPGEGLVRLWSSAPDPNKSVNTYVEEVRTTHQKALRRLAKAAAAVLPEGAEPKSVRRRMERGTPRDVIPAQVKALNADLLIMGTIARTGIPGFIIGNTAEDVLNAVDCSVVTIKPPNYVSPVPVNRLP